jgi:hypothetical protein
MRSPSSSGSPGKHLELLVAAPFGLTHAAADFGAIAGFTVGIERLTSRLEDTD